MSLKSTSFPKELCKSLFFPMQNKLKGILNTERRKTAKHNNAKINFSPNMHCTFLLIKSNAILQIFFLINLLFREVLRKSVFPIVNV